MAMAAPRCLSRYEMLLSFVSHPDTTHPCSRQITANPLMPIPPIPIKWMRIPGRSAIDVVMRAAVARFGVPPTRRSPRRAGWWPRAQTTSACALPSHGAAWDPS